MMRLLHWVLAPRESLPPFPSSWGSPPPEHTGSGDASFSSLYSDVGNFYANAGPNDESGGWVVRDPVGSIWKVNDATHIGTNGSYKFGWLNEHGCEDAWARDAHIMRRELRALDSQRTTFTYTPVGGVGAFLIFRTFYHLPGHNLPVPKKWGVQIQSDNDIVSEYHFATWSFEGGPPPTTLVITRLRSSPATFPTLLSCAVEAAKEQGLTKVEIWNLPAHLSQAALNLGGENEVRSEHLNAFKWYGRGSEDDVEWLHNEK